MFFTGIKVGVMPVVYSDIGHLNTMIVTLTFLIN